jgi:hypothetical protein
MSPQRRNIFKLEEHPSAASDADVVKDLGKHAKYIGIIGKNPTFTKPQVREFLDKTL